MFGFRALDRIEFEVGGFAMRVFDGLLKGDGSLLTVSDLFVALSRKDYQSDDGKERCRIERILCSKSICFGTIVLDIALINF